MNLQIDLKPVGGNCNASSYYLDLFIDGQSVRSTISRIGAMQLVETGIVQQVFGQRHNKRGELENFEYDNKLDGAGVQYTSALFDLFDTNLPVITDKAPDSKL